MFTTFIPFLCYKSMRINQPVYFLVVITVSTPSYGIRQATVTMALGSKNP